MVIVMTLGQRIQQIRGEHGLSQEEFAEKLGTTRQTVSRWELDQTFPEIAKIVLISKVFSVTTDSILKDGISTFDTDFEHFKCGVYRGNNCEIVETEKFALMLYCSSDKNTLGIKLYKGYENKKRPLRLAEGDNITAVPPLFTHYKASLIRQRASRALLSSAVTVGIRMSLQNLRLICSRSVFIVA